MVSGSFGVTRSSQGDVPSKMAKSGMLFVMYSSNAAGKMNVASHGKMKPNLLSRMSFAVVTYDPRVVVRVHLIAEGRGKLWLRIESHATSAWKSKSRIVVLRKKVGICMVPARSCFELRCC